MEILASLSMRRRQAEIMDQPGLHPELHQHALRGLAAINWLSRSDAILWPAIERLAREKPGRPLRVLDIASGGGDVLHRLQRRARRANLPIDFTGVDFSPTAVEHAKALGAGVTFSVLDVLHTPFPIDYDVIMSSLFLHHLDSKSASELLRRMGEATRSLVLINDLVRSSPGYVLAWIGTRLLTRSHVVHVDGPRSVEGAFTIAEALKLAESAGLHGATATWRWPFRFLLQWRRPT